MSLFFTKFVKLDPDPHSFYLLDPDPHSEKLLDLDLQKNESTALLQRKENETKNCKL